LNSINPYYTSSRGSTAEDTVAVPNYKYSETSATTLSGERWVDIVSFLFKDYNRITIIADLVGTANRLNVIGVNSSDPKGYTQLLNGIIGVQPAATAYLSYDFLD